MEHAGGRVLKIGSVKWMRYFFIGTELAASVLGGLFIGNLVDGYFGTETPWFTLLGLVLGMAAGLVFMLRILKRLDEEPGDSGGDGNG